MTCAPGLVTPDAARREYGLVMAGPEQAVDEAATRALRSLRQSAAETSGAKEETLAAD